jgi:hypothetical protein
MTLNYNAGKACDAIVRRIEAREGKSREGVRSPEKDGHENPIEVVCQIDGQLFAFEHTGVEPFAGHMEMDARASFISSATSTLPTVFKITASSKRPRPGSPVRENAMAPQCPAVFASEPAIRTAWSELGLFRVAATMSPSPSAS